MRFVFITVVSQNVVVVSLGVIIPRTALPQTLGNLVRLSYPDTGDIGYPDIG